MTEGKNDFPYLDTKASRMLASGIQRANVRDGISLRQLGKQLGYKQAVVLSHMASGRVPIPINRAQELAAAVEIDQKTFLAAVLGQRHPEVDWALITEAPASGDTRLNLTAELTGGRAVEELTPGQRAVMREVAADPQAPRRWLSVHEVGAVDMLRELRPGMAREGLALADQRALRDALGKR